MRVRLPPRPSLQVTCPVRPREIENARIRRGRLGPLAIWLRCPPVTYDDRTTRARRTHDGDPTTRHPALGGPGGTVLAREWAREPPGISPGLLGVDLDARAQTLRLRIRPPPSSPRESRPFQFDPVTAFATALSTCTAAPRTRSRPRVRARGPRGPCTRASTRGSRPRSSWSRAATRASSCSRRSTGPGSSTRAPGRGPDRPRAVCRTPPAQPCAGRSRRGAEDRHRLPGARPVSYRRVLRAGTPGGRREAFRRRRGGAWGTIRRSGRPLPSSSWVSWTAA